MPSYRTSAIISRPIAEVFDYLTDVSAWPRWMNVERTDPVTPGPPKVGGRAEGTMREGGRSLPFTIEISQLDPGRTIGFRTLSGPIDWEGSWEVRKIDEGTTEVTAMGTMRLRGIRRVLEPFMAGEVRKGEAAELVRLRSILEARQSLGDGG
jgi:uncharacterized protein YndB with AHSA1/START domain